MAQVRADAEAVTRIDRLCLKFFVTRYLKWNGSPGLTIQPPHLALGCRDQPGLPVALTVGLGSKEMHPGDRARLLHDVGRRVDSPPHPAKQLLVEGRVQRGLVASEPSAAALGGGW